MHSFFGCLFGGFMPDHAIRYVKASEKAESMYNVEEAGASKGGKQSDMTGILDRRATA
jgi:hypothetical protein